jgi:hypothetical protein
MRSNQGVLIVQETESELKPCPFCGGMPMLTNWGLWRVWCKDCKATAGDFVIMKDAKIAWNNRVKGDKSVY